MVEPLAAQWKGFVAEVFDSSATVHLTCAKTDWFRALARRRPKLGVRNPDFNRIAEPSHARPSSFWSTTWSGAEIIRPNGGESDAHRYRLDDREVPSAVTPTVGKYYDGCRI